MASCPGCGAPLQADASACSYCGIKIEPAPKPEEPMSVSVSISVNTSPHSAGETQQPPDTPAKKTPSAGTVISVVIGLALFLAVKWVKNPSYLAIVHDRFSPAANQSAV